jgi:hypothetical protein
VTHELSPSVTRISAARPAAAIAFENRGLQEGGYASFAVVTLTIVSHAPIAFHSLNDWRNLTLISVVMNLV